MTARKIPWLVLALLAAVSAVAQSELARGEAALRAEDYGTSAREFEAARRSVGDTRPVLRGLLQSYLQLKNLPAAIAVGESAAGRWPGDGHIRHWLGVAYLQSGDAMRATRELKAAAKVRPASYDVRFDLALAYLSGKQYFEAAGE